MRALTFLIDYRPVKRVDLYLGVMISNVYAGLARGYQQYGTGVFAVARLSRTELKICIGGNSLKNKPPGCSSSKFN